MPTSDEPDFYERDGLNVLTYDLRTEQDAAQGVLAGDVDFYRTLAMRTGGPVLDLGGGTGRVARPLAEAGFDVWCMDLSAGMLRQGRASVEGTVAAERIRFIQGDMSSFELEERAFGLTIAPFRAFQLLLDAADQRSCLAAVRGHLRPGGLLALHLFDPLLDRCTPEAGSVFEREEGEFPLADGGRVQTTVLERLNDPLRQVFEERWRFREITAAGEVVRQEEERLAMRWTYRYEMRNLLEICGFDVDSEASDFFGSPPAYGREQVWVARRA